MRRCENNHTQVKQTMPLEIRQAQTSDLDAMLKMAHDNIDTNYRRFLGDSGVNQFIDSGIIDQYLSHSLSRCTIARQDGDLVGFAVLDEDLIELIMIAHRLHRGGIGAKLLQHCEQEMFGEYDKIRLESFEGAAKANQFYTKHGWTPLEREPDPDSGINKFVLIKHRP